MSQVTTDKPLMSIDELCETLDIGRNIAYQLLNSHAIDAFRVGHVWKIPRDSVMNFIKQKASDRAQIPVNLPQSKAKKLATTSKKKTTKQ